eukprot:5048832-Amphidinium_carterae.1
MMRKMILMYDNAVSNVCTFSLERTTGRPTSRGLSYNTRRRMLSRYGFSFASSHGEQTAYVGAPSRGVCCLQHKNFGVTEPFLFHHVFAAQEQPLVK